MKEFFSFAAAHDSVMLKGTQVTLPEKEVASMRASPWSGPKAPTLRSPSSEADQD